MVALHLSVGEKEYIQAARMRKTKAHCLDLQCKLGQRLCLPWWKGNVLVKENGQGVGAGRSVGVRESGGEIFGHGWHVCVFVVVFLCVSVYGICGVLGVIACGNLFLVKRRIFAKEGWHYDTWHVMSEDFM
jgi:hypothetical protein